MLNAKCEEFHADNHYYFFVVLGMPDERPSYHVVPSAVVAEITTESHKNWLKTPGAKGRLHKDTSVRQFHDPGDKYLEYWELLGLG